MSFTELSMKSEVGEEQFPHAMYATSEASQSHPRDESKFLKEEQHSKRNDSDRDDESQQEHRASRKKRKHHHRHRSSRTTDYDPAFQRTGEYDNPDHRHRESLYDGLNDQSLDEHGINTEEAFRESLFDALADDEGAAYWEGVYGQPVHVYPKFTRGPNGELERMNDEEYADYVRTKMWEKSNQNIVKEREARENARRKRKDKKHYMQEEAAAREEAERKKIRRQMRANVKRDEEQKQAHEFEAAWEHYTKKWADLKRKSAQNHAARVQDQVHEMIAWPVMSGKPQHVSKEEIEHFFENSKAWTQNAAGLLKAERIRWHPDKMQQRFGQRIDESTMKLVTAVFQVVDRLWNERR